MDRITAFIERHPVSAYFALVILISWTAVAAIVGPSSFPLEWERFERLGAAIYAAAIAGPVISGLLLTGLLDGRGGLSELVTRLRKWRVGARWWGIALLPAVAIASTLSALPLVSPELTPTIFASEEMASAVMLGITVGLFVGVFEEVGWTGFAVPRLRRRHGMVATGVIIGLVWGAWHFPLFWEADSFSGPVPFALLMVRLFSWLPALRILLVWIHDRTASLLLPMLMHGCVAAVSAVVITPDVSGVDLWTVTLAWPVVMWLLVGIMAAVSPKPRPPRG